MRITKRANIAMRVLMYCAARPGQRITKSAIARTCNASEHHLGQIVNQLAQLGYLRTWRGRYGGMSLARPAHEISAGELFRSIESELPIAECFSAETNTCPLVQGCRLRPALARAAEAFYAALDTVTLDMLTDDNDVLADLLSQPATAPCGSLTPVPSQRLAPARSIV